MNDPLPLQTVAEPERAELLLHPLRQRILRHAAEPRSASEIARLLDLPPQKVNYHVRALADAGFLHPAGERRKRNLVEKRYRASALSYLVLPAVLGEMAADPGRGGDAVSAGHLLGLSARLQAELAGALVEAGQEADRVPTFAMDAELRFTSGDQRAAFAEALQEAVLDVIARFSAPALDRQGAPGGGRGYRLVLGCHPLPSAAGEGGPRPRGDGRDRSAEGDKRDAGEGDERGGERSAERDGAGAEITTNTTREDKG
jgi:DNA-binding transcriptional ArsR family regulator